MKKSPRQFVFDGMELIPTPLRKWVAQHSKGKLKKGWSKAFVEKGLGYRDKSTGQIHFDQQALFNFIDTYWAQMFRGKLGRTERAYINELKDVRNDLAHSVEFTSDDAERALDTMRRLMMAIGANDTAEKLNKLRADIRDIESGVKPVPTPAQPVAQPTASAPVMRLPPQPARQAPAPRKTITTEMAQKTCELGDKVYAGSLHRKSAEAELAEMGMNPGSAFMYVMIYLEMLEGKVFKRTAAKPHLRLFMEHILEKHGRDKFANSILALEKNIEYREGLGLTCRGEQAILDDMRNKRDAS